jgi:hypothetical protein
MAWRFSGETVYLYAYNTIAKLRDRLRIYFYTFNQDRNHPGVARKTPNEVYLETKLWIAA